MSFEYNYEEDKYSDTDIELTLENAHNTDNKIIIIENTINELRDDVSNIWHDIILPYINDNGQILNKLYKCNASTYIKFICQNNKEYTKLIDELDHLYRIKEREYELPKKK